MTIPSRPAPPPPTSSTNRSASITQNYQQQQYKNGGVASNNIAIKLPPPPGSRNYQLNLTNNHHSFLSDTPTPIPSNINSSTKITRHFPIAKTRYAPSTNWNGSPFDPISSSQQFDQINIGVSKKIPPPRPPPPRVNTPTNINGVLKKPGQPQSVNVLSNLFGRKKTNNTTSKKQQSIQNLPKNSSQISSNDNSTTAYQSTSSLFFESSFQSSTNWGNTDVQLITFDSPPSSPTFTQKSNSDCVSVDSFSSDSNFSSPNNGNISQPESGFEDDFSASTTISQSDPWETSSTTIYNNSDGARSNYMMINDLKVSHPVRNLSAMNKIQDDNHLCNGKTLVPPPPTLSMPTIIRPKGQKSAAPKPPIILPKPNTLGPKSIAPTNPIGTFYNEDEPPMPNCPPPPPPPESLAANLNTDYQQFMHENIDYDGPAYGISLYAFDSAEIGDLSFRENEKIYLIKKLNDEWYMGRTKSGCEGIFPSNYIDIKVKLKDETNKLQNIETIKTKIKVLYNFIAEQPEDLTLQENDLVTVLYKVNDDWLFGELNNKRGLFPANFIEYIPQDLPLKMP